MIKITDPEELNLFSNELEKKIIEIQHWDTYILFFYKKSFFFRGRIRLSRGLYENIKLKIL